MAAAYYRATIFINKSDLIQRLCQRYPHLPSGAVEAAVKGLIDHLAETFSVGGRIEIRGFGSFALRFRAPRLGRNPMTGTPVQVDAHYVPHFKPGKELRDRVNGSLTGDVPQQFAAETQPLP